MLLSGEWETHDHTALSDAALRAIDRRNGGRTGRFVNYASVIEALEPHGLIARGGFEPRSGDGLGPDAAVVVMVGNAGPAMWRAFAQAREQTADPLNRWTRRVLDAVARRFGAEARYPFDGPPWLPFQRWARRAEAVFESPVGMLVHPEYGLWHAYRGALVFDRPLDGLPGRPDAPSPCETCEEKPCLSTCPVGAFTAGAYDVPACARHLETPQGSDCMTLGCRARRACPVGQDHVYQPDHALFHMEAFLRSRRSACVDSANKRTAGEPGA